MSSLLNNANHLEKGLIISGIVLLALGLIFDGVLVASWVSHRNVSYLHVRSAAWCFDVSSRGDKMKRPKNERGAQN